MRALARHLVLAGSLFSSACTTDLVGRHGVDAAAPDAAIVAPHDAGAPVDAPSLADVGVLADAWAAPDAGVAIDVGPGCTPAYDCTSCCGAAPDGCGSTLACDACVDDVWCAPSTARFASQVQAAVQSVMDTRPELFDPVMFRDTSSWLVVDDARYTAAVVAACNAAGLVCISDPNDDHELRVRASTDHLAENYGVRVHATNRTWYRFMGGVCETTQF